MFADLWEKFKHFQKKETLAEKKGEKVKSTCLFVF